MIRYVLAATALKAFSLNSTTKDVYRRLGNTLGAKSRARSELDTYINRGNLLVGLYRKYDPLVCNARVLEIGTGWMHWYGLYLRLFNDIKLTTLDVWDNRQFQALQGCFARLRGVLNPVPSTLDTILASHDFEDLYARLQIDHHIIPDGSLELFEKEVFDSICSMHVLEHVPREGVPNLLAQMHRSLKPGRIMVHQIGLADHIAQYDQRVSLKQYVGCSSRMWKTFYENELQYINLLQVPDWHGAFHTAGFVIVDEIRRSIDLNGLRIAPAFEHYSTEDLAVTNLTIVLRKL